MSISPEESPQERKQARWFDQGVRRLNARQWFEAHEAWEALWHGLAKDDPRRPFVQGLIQCAVALEHLRRGNPRGSLRTFERACRRLEPFPDVYMGVPLRALVAQMEAMLTPWRERADKLPRRGGFPRRDVALPVDLDRAPRIELELNPFVDPATDCH